MTIRYIDGVPNWFTWLAHHWWRRRCMRVGHDDGGFGRPAGGCCMRCGWEWGT